MSIDAFLFCDQDRAPAVQRGCKFCRRPFPFFLLLSLTLVLFWACGRGNNEVVLTPPLTPPLTRSVIGYGVINKSYTHLTETPDYDGVSRGYLRRGSVIRVVERRSVIAPDRAESWVLVEGDSRGWLPETEVDIYDNEGQARTAAEINSTGVLNP
jgi:hypothetical protein